MDTSTDEPSLLLSLSLARAILFLCPRAFCAAFSYQTRASWRCKP